MLYEICFEFNESSDDYAGFFGALNRLGRWIQPFERCVLLDSVYTAEGLRKKLLPYLHEHDRMVITKMYRGQCAGKLPERCKRFIGEFIGHDPFR